MPWRIQVALFSANGKTYTEPYTFDITMRLWRIPKGSCLGTNRELNGGGGSGILAPLPAKEPASAKLP